MSNLGRSGWIGSVSRTPSNTAPGGNPNSLAARNESFATVGKTSVSEARSKFEATNKPSHPENVTRQPTRSGQNSLNSKLMPEKREFSERPGVDSKQELNEQWSGLSLKSAGGAPRVVTKSISPPAPGHLKMAEAALFDDPDWLDDYNTFHNGTVAKFIASSKELGGELKTQAEKLELAFSELKNLMVIAARNGLPSQNDLQVLLKPLSDAIVAAQDVREKNRNSKQFSHLSAVSEGIPALGWVAVSPKPAAYVKQMVESAQFYTNKLLKEFRASDPKQADWSVAWIKLLNELADYAKDSHPTGLKWAPGKPAATGATKAGAVGGAAKPPAAPAPPRPPPPPGPPPPPAPVAATGAADDGDDSRAALFSSLNKGSDVTKGLKKVTDDMKTHKNPDLRKQGPVAAPGKASPLAPRPYSPPQVKKFSAPGQQAPAKQPPVFELQNKKWVVEWQEHNRNLVIANTNPAQTVYIYKCTDSVIQVKGKVNSITLDQCKKCGVIFDDLIGTCEMVNCSSVEVQAQGQVPTISIDKSDSIQVYLNEKNVHAQIVSAKSSGMNICVTSKSGDLKEFPIPEQFKSSWDGSKFVTTVNDMNL